MLKFLIIYNKELFTTSSTESTANNISDQLKSRGHLVESIGIPINLENPVIFKDQVLMMRTMETRNIDCLIALSYPACLLRHQQKIIYMTDDFLPTNMIDIMKQQANAADYEQVIAFLNNTFDESIKESKRVMAHTDVIANALKELNIDAPVGINRIMHTLKN